MPQVKVSLENCYMHFCDVILVVKIFLLIIGCNGPVKCGYNVQKFNVDELNFP